MDLTSIKYDKIAEVARKTNKFVTCFDLETTGLRGPTCGITDVALVSVSPSGKIAFAQGLVNPEFPISPQASEVTGITDDMVRHEPTWGQKWAPLFKRMADENHIMVGFNLLTFDVPIVIEQNIRYGVSDTCYRIVSDVRKIYNTVHNQKKGKLSEVASLYGVSPKGNLHRAFADAVLTFELLESMLENKGISVIKLGLKD